MEVRTVRHEWEVVEVLHHPGALPRTLPDVVAWSSACNECLTAGDGPLLMEGCGCQEEEARDLQGSMLLVPVAQGGRKVVALRVDDPKEVSDRQETRSCEEAVGVHPRSASIAENGVGWE